MQSKPNTTPQPTLKSLHKAHLKTIHTAELTAGHYLPRLHKSQDGVLLPTKESGLGARADPGDPMDLLVRTVYKGNSGNVKSKVVSKKNKRKKDDGSNSVFSTFTLNRDPSCSEYMPYDAVSYPKLDQGPSTDSNNNTRDASVEKAKLENMYLVSFLHHSNQMEQKSHSNRLNTFISLPGTSAVLPTSSVRRDLKVKSKKFLEGRVEGVEDARFVYDKNKKKSRDTVAKMSNNEVYRLNELSVLLKPKPKQDNIYAQTNRKIITSKRQKFIPKPKTKMTSKFLDRIYESTRLTTQSAITIQTVYKRYRILARLRNNALLGLRIRCIQAIVRGVIARKWMRLWVRFRMYMIVQWQALIRRYVYGKRAAAERAKCVFFATKCQACVRMWLCKRRMYNLKRTLCVVVIQAAYRGTVARFKCDKMWLNRRVTTIQRFVRRVIYTEKNKHNIQVMVSASSVITRFWRGFEGRRVRNRKLFDRQVHNRSEQCRLLKVDEVYYADYVTKLHKKIKLLNFTAKQDKLNIKHNELLASIKSKEINYIELLRQRQCLSPRDISKGWVNELDSNIVDYRSKITKNKLDYLFDTVLEMRGIEEEEKKRNEQLQHFQNYKKSVTKWREEELDNLWALQTLKVASTAEKVRLARIANERRKWTVTFKKPSGKPDKLRKTGRPWDVKAYATDANNTFYGGSTNILADNNNSMQDKLRLGSTESINKLMERLQLQSYHNQNVQYEALLRPLAENMEKGMFGGKADSVDICPGVLDDIGMGEKVEVEVKVKVQVKVKKEKKVQGTAAFEEMYVQPPIQTYNSKQKRDDALKAHTTTTTNTTTNVTSVNKTKYRKPISRLPWNLLDELQSEKEKFMTEVVTERMKKSLGMKERAGKREDEEKRAVALREEEEEEEGLD